MSESELQTVNQNYSCKRRPYSPNVVRHRCNIDPFHVRSALILVKFCSKTALRAFTDYLLANGNTTLDYNCMQAVSNTLPVTMIDFDDNTVIRPFNMRSGIDLKFYRAYRI